jgi:adenylate cyclase
MATPQAAPPRRPLIQPLHLAAIGLALGLSLLAQWFFPGGFAAIDHRFGDAVWRLGATTVTEQRIAIIDIDEASLAEIGPWPWPRERLAQLSEALAAQGAGLQIFDIVLSEDRPGDAAVAAILQRNQAIIGQVFALEQGAPIRSGLLRSSPQSPPCTVGSDATALALPVAHGYLAPAASIAEVLASGRVGHITPRVANDGIVRQQPAYICMDGDSHPALALAAYLQGAGVPATAPVDIIPGRGWLAPPWQLEVAGLSRPIPLNQRGDLQIPYTLAPSAIVAVSAADLLAGRIPPGLLKGAWALVSSTAFGLGDVVATPHAGAQGGASVHVQLLAGLLDERLPHTPQGLRALQALAALLALVVLGGLLAAGRNRHLPGYALSLAGVSLAALLLVFQGWAQTHLGLIAGMSLPACAILLAGLLLGLAEFIRTGSEHSRLLAHLASYLPRPVAARLLAQSPRAEILAEQREVTVLFADIRNFSAYCEAYDASEAARLLHRFLTTACEIVEAHGGLIETMQGDAIMAVWNGSTPCADHVAQALQAAREMHRRIEAEFPRLPEDARIPPLGLGIGLESGMALIGSFGPQNRRMHSALGQTVTRAARLQALTADLSWPILTGPGLWANLADSANPAAPGATTITANARPVVAHLISQGEFLLEGLTQPCPVYALAPSHSS